jgi:nucleoside-diphosphate-sugar epimerase
MMPISPADLVFVTGGTGHTGVYLIRALVARGYRVRATSRAPPDQPGVEWRHMDFHQDLDFDAMLEGCSAVLHLGAELSIIDRMQRANVEATEALAASAERAGVRFFCYTSSVAVYGSPRTRAVTEETPVITSEREIRQEYKADEAARAYARTKLLGEMRVKAGARHAEYVIFRPTMIATDADILDVRGWSLARRLLLGYRHTHQIHVDDFVHAILWFMERAIARGRVEPGVSIYNLSNDDIEQNTVASLLHKADRQSGGRRALPVPHAPGMMDFLGSMLKYRNLQLRYPFGMVRYSPDKLYATGYRHKLGIIAAQDLALRRAAPRPLG